MRTQNGGAGMMGQLSIGAAGLGLAAALTGGCLCGSAAAAETLTSALVKAYRNNPQLNAQRANVRQVDEEVPQALSGYRPKVAATASAGVQQVTNTLANSFGGRTVTDPVRYPHSAGVAVTQPLFDVRVPNQVGAAENSVRAARETLRLITQQVLLDAATAYMNMLRDRSIEQLQRGNVQMHEDQLRQTRERMRAREVTNTDLTQAETRLAGALAQLAAAEAATRASAATYRRVIGEEAKDLSPGQPVENLLPRSLDEAVAIGLGENPAVTAAQFGIDVAAFQVKVAEGALYPTVQAQGAVQHGRDQNPQIERQTSAAAFVVLTMPLYQGGGEFAAIRQSKEHLSQRRFELDHVRDLARATIVENWSRLAAARLQIEAARQQVNAAEQALNNVRQEVRAGQRTTLDALNAQQELVGARVLLVSAHRDRVVNSYAVLGAIGRLMPDVLRLPTDVYDPTANYHQVRDSWFGVRTSDRR